MYTWKRDNEWSPAEFSVSVTNRWDVTAWVWIVLLQNARLRQLLFTYVPSLFLPKRRLLIEFNWSRVLHVFFYWASRWRSWWVIKDFYVASTRINGWFLLCFKSFGQFGHFRGLTRYFQEANVYNNVNISVRPIFMTFWLIRCDQSKSLDTSKQKWTENVYNSSWMWNLIWLKKWVKPKY